MTIGIASGLAPFALAAIADHVGVHTAFLIVPVLMVLAIVLVRAEQVPLPEPVVEAGEPTA